MRLGRIVMWRSCGRRPPLAAGLMLATLLGGGCGKSGIAAELAAFTDGGQTVSAFSPVDAAGLGAKSCQSGSLNQIPALVCEYGSSDAAALGHPGAESWAGNTGTVLVLHRDKMLLAVADRNKVDPNGKQLSVLAKIFRRIKGR